MLTRSGSFDQLGESSGIQQGLKRLRDWLHRRSRNLWRSHRTIRSSIRGDGGLVAASMETWSRTSFNCSWVSCCLCRMPWRSSSAFRRC